MYMHVHAGFCFYSSLWILSPRYHLYSLRSPRTRPRGCQAGGGSIRADLWECALLCGHVSRFPRIMLSRFSDWQMAFIYTDYMGLHILMNQHSRTLFTNRKHFHWLFSWTRPGWSGKSSVTTDLLFTVVKLVCLEIIHFTKQPRIRGCKLVDYFGCFCPYAVTCLSQHKLDADRWKNEIAKMTWRLLPNLLCRIKLSKCFLKSHTGNRFLAEKTGSIGIWAYFIPPKCFQTLHGWNDAETYENFRISRLQ